MIFNIIFIFQGLLSVIKKNKLLNVLISLLLLILACFREKHIGVDSIAYYEYGEILKNMQFFEIINNKIWIEKGYSFYSKVIMIFQEPYAILFITSLITLLMIYRFCYKYSKNYIYSIFIFQGMMYYYSSINIIRQFLAISLCLYAYQFIFQKKWIKFYFTIFIAYFFHKTSIVFIILYLLKDVELNKKRIKMIFILALIFYFMIDKILLISTVLLPNYQGYLSLEHYTDFNLGNRILFIKDFIIAFYLYKIEFFKSKEEMLDMWIVILSTMISFFSIKLGILIRIQLYFSIFYIVIIPNSIYQKSNQKFLTILIIIIYHSILFWIKKDWYLVYPYKSFLFQ